MATHMALPVHFCWTRFGTEAGQTADQILHRKEQERLANNGIFLWGIGNSVGPGVRELARNNEYPEVLFSPIKGCPRTVDAAPESIVAWTLGETDEGKLFALPRYSLVTSRQSVSSPKSTHYALVCFSSAPLTLSAAPPSLEFGALRNFVSGNPVGASQVTAVVKRDSSVPAKIGNYRVALRAHLLPPFFIRLRGPVLLRQSENAVTDWYATVQSVWDQRIRLSAGGTALTSRYEFARRTLLLF